MLQPDVIAAMHAQIDKLAYAHSSFFTSEVSEALADHLASHAPAGLDNVYFVSGGSEAMEAALEVVIRDRNFDDGAGRTALLQLFEVLAGSEQHDDLVREFRRKLSAALN